MVPRGARAMPVVPRGARVGAPSATPKHHTLLSLNPVVSSMPVILSMSLVPAMSGGAGGAIDVGGAGGWVVARGGAGFGG
ncbi:hypothetical protein Hdeb2414_s0011g00370601 [Helianthus debilis subsp. tardiflorus]